MVWFETIFVITFYFVLLIKSSDCNSVTIKNFASKLISCHCSSKDDRLEYKNLNLTEEYTFKFWPNVWGTTLFWCTVSYFTEDKSFVVYGYNRKESDNIYVIDTTVILVVNTFVMLLTKVLFSEQKLNFVVLGATGFTGRYVVQEMCRTLAKNKNHIVWGIAGRNRDRLLQILRHSCQHNGSDFSKIQVMDVDINDRNSLLQMCRNSSLIVNCCGPYRLLGEQVVSACIESGCHHIDVSGEPQFLETIQHKYNERALQQKVSIIGSCGFDSVPSDIGVQFLKSQFDGTLNSVEYYLRVSTTSNRPVTYNFATWHSLVYGYAFRKQLSQLRRQLYSSQLKTYQWKHVLKRKSLVRNQFGYCVPFPGSDRSVVSRTQSYNYTHLDERPVQIETYFTVQSRTAVLALFFVNFAVSLLSPYPMGRQLLMSYPNIFSFGVFNKRTQPKEETLLKNSFEIILIGKGWSQRYDAPNWQPNESPNKTLAAKISGGDLAYLDTSKIVTQITLIIIELIKENRLKYGVLTPSVAFSDTPIIDRLNRNHIKFEITKEN